MTNSRSANRMIFPRSISSLRDRENHSICAQPLCIVQTPTPLISSNSQEAPDKRRCRSREQRLRLQVRWLNCGAIAIYQANLH
ncbi:hypothetical protein QUB68_15055 [Microcoleus sp. A006_D1]|uniref:hypothetical protein n=1 Tax=Microcoleus sp. A006_D1 TaxID=3055267 RepID=UPI002FD54F25